MSTGGAARQAISASSLRRFAIAYESSARGAAASRVTDGHGKSLPIHTVPVNFTEKAHQLPVCRERLTEPANDPQANVRDGGLRAQVEDRVVVPRLVHWWVVRAQSVFRVGVVAGRGALALCRFN